MQKYCIPHNLHYIKRTIFFLAGAITLLFYSSCSSKKKAEAIYFNGKIYTVDSSFSIAEAFAVKNGKIISVGNSKDVMNEFDAKEKYDLDGKPVYPGFIDAHCHFFGYASDLQKADLYGTKSFDEVIQKITDYAKTNKFSWILGRGWDQNDWDVKTFPSKEKLDSLFPGTPVFLTRVDGHAVLCNNAALNTGHITASTKVSGGEIEIINGKLTGILIDNAVELVERNIPPYSKEIYKEYLLQAQKNCFAAGLTTLDDAGLGHDTIQLIDELQKSGELKIRIYAMVSDNEENRNYFFEHGHIKTDRLDVRSFKVYADGALGSRGACLLQPYMDESNHYGFLLHDKKYFDDVAEKMYEHGFQLCTHAIGDSANRLMLRIYASHLKGTNDRRWRIEHCQFVDASDLKLFAENDIIPSVQPTHATSDMYWVGERLGNERVKTAYAYKDLMNNSNGRIAFGTDFPVEDINPLYTFYASVARKDLKGFPENGFQSENKIDRKNTLRAMTILAAYSNFEENEKGSIEKGKLADFVILDRDVMLVDEKEIPKTMVIATYVNGEKVFEKSSK
jgi:predicted amidohydrolase YtcJ